MHQPLRVGGSLLGLGALLCLGGAVEGQDAPVASAEREWSTPMTRVIGVRELSDGRVLALDQVEQRLILFDDRSDTATVIGRHGAGPGEFQMAMALFGLANDTSALFDIVNQRLIRIDPHGVLSEFPHEVMDQLRTVGPPAQSDTLGRFYSALRVAPPPRSDLPHLAIVRWTRMDEAVDTITTVGTFERQLEGRELGFRRSEDWVVTPSGAIVTVDSWNYHVRWIENGALNEATLPHRERPVRDAHKEEWLREKELSPSLMLGIGPGGQRRGFMKRTASDERLVVESFAWPAILPVYWHKNALVAASDGKVWVRRTRLQAEDPERYDVLDSSLRVLRTEFMPANTRVVAVGRHAIYAVRRNADDLELLQRFRLPAAR